MKDEIVLYQPNETVQMEVRLHNETVWLNRNQMAMLFGRDVKTIGKHINNALKEELCPTVSKNATVQSEINLVVAKTATTEIESATEMSNEHSVVAQKPSDLTENGSETVILEQKPSFPTPLVRAVYECICSNPKLKYRQLERELDVSESTILRAINWLKINGYINKDHSKVNGQWQLTN